METEIAKFGGKNRAELIKLNAWLAVTRKIAGILRRLNERMLKIILSRGPTLFHLETYCTG